MARIATFAQARIAALRLSDKHPSQDFFVLQSCWGRMARHATEERSVASDVPVAGPDRSEPA